MEPEQTCNSKGRRDREVKKSKIKDFFWPDEAITNKIKFTINPSRLWFPAEQKETINKKERHKKKKKSVPSKPHKQRPPLAAKKSAKQYDDYERISNIWLKIRRSKTITIKN